MGAVLSVIIMTIGLGLCAFFSGSNIVEDCQKKNNKGALWSAVLALVLGIGILILTGEFL